MRNLARSVPFPLPAPAAPRSPSRPPSATDFRLALLALASVVGLGVFLRGRPLDGDTRMLAVMGAIALPLAAGDLLLLKVHRRASTGLDWNRPFQLDLPRILTKLLGLGVTLGALALVYWLFPEYRGGFFAAFFRALDRVAIPAGVFAVAYVAVVDGRMRAPRDAYWQLGRCALGRFRDARPTELADHARAWLVKGFFLPLMITYLHGSTSRILDWNLAGATWANLRLYDFLHDAVFFIDLAFACVGYAYSLRLADTHVRRAERTMLGWIVALLCYQPFFSVFDAHYLSYGGPGFGRVLADWPTVRAIWAGVILTLVVVYSLATVSFGLRFSNLTNRGIITSGPYRFTKHPAYLSKNLSWWLASMPFAVSGGAGEQVRHVLMLVLLNLVYFMRARAEERHLSDDPRYVEYALWMNDHGILRSLGRWMPFLRYRPPPAPDAVR